MKERLKLVTSFASLKAGDYVLDLRCEICGRECRALLLSLAVDGNGYPFWAYAGRCGKWETEEQYAGIGESEVVARRLYLIDTGLEDSDTQTSKRSTKKSDPKKLERAR